MSFDPPCQLCGCVSIPGDMVCPECLVDFAPSLAEPYDEELEDEAS